MALTDLVGKYKDGLSVPQNAPPTATYSIFATELIQTPNYPYDITEMKEMGKFLLDNNFSCTAREYILGVITRRKAMDNINDTERRAVIWDIMDNYLDDTKIQKTVESLGKPQIITDLDSMLSMYKPINSALHHIWQERLKLLQKAEYKAEAETLFSIGHDHSHYRAMDQVVITILKKKLEKI